MAEDSDLEKTESASPRRIEQAREEGQVPQSRELQTLLVLMGGVLGLWASGSWVLTHMETSLRTGLSIERVAAFDVAAMMRILRELSEQGLLAIVPFLVVACVAAVAGPMILGGMNFAPNALRLDLERLSPLSGIKRIFSSNGLVELLKGILKSVLIGGVGVAVLWIYRFELLALMHQSLNQGIADFGHLMLVATLLSTGHRR